MALIKPSAHGIVVDHKETGVRYAISDRNYDQRIHSKVRDLKAGESVASFRPKAKESLGTEASTSGTPAPAGDQAVAKNASQ